MGHISSMRLFCLGWSEEEPKSSSLLNIVWVFKIGIFACFCADTKICKTENPKISNFVASLSTPRRCTFGETQVNLGNIDARGDVF